MNIAELNAQMTEIHRILARNLAENFYGDNALTRRFGPPKPRPWLERARDWLGTAFVRLGEWLRGYSESDY